MTSPDATVTIASTDRSGSSVCGSPSYPTVAICDPSGDQAGLSQKRLDSLPGYSFTSGCGFVPCGSVIQICCGRRTFTEGGDDVARVHRTVATQTGLRLLASALVRPA